MNCSSRTSQDVLAEIENMDYDESGDYTSCKTNRCLPSARISE
ncbi:hypothetical protein [Clostridium pasteurianum]|nr:hypothetical protein [Clostridium pasteurianum]